MIFKQVSIALGVAIDRLGIDGGLHRIEPCQLHCQHRMRRLRLDEIPKRFDHVLLHGVRRNA